METGAVGALTLVKRIQAPFESMSKKMGTMILIYGAIMCIGALALRSAAPQKSALIVITLVIGVVALVIGFAAWMGETRRRWVVITSVASTLVMVAQAVGEWAALSEGSGALVRIVTTLGAVASFGMLLYGIHGERPPEFYQPTLPQSDTGSGKDQAKR